VEGEGLGITSSVLPKNLRVQKCDVSPERQSSTGMRKEGQCPAVMGKKRLNRHFGSLGVGIKNVDQQFQRFSALAATQVALLPKPHSQRL
jgi:hypothetical protein